MGEVSIPTNTHKKKVKRIGKYQLELRKKVERFKTQVLL
jgi:hypothetical protein